MRSEYFFGFIISFISGVAFESIFNFGYSFAILCVSLSLLLYFLPSNRMFLKSVFLVSLVLLGFAMGVFRVDVTQKNTSAHSLDKFVGGTISLEGVVLTEPDVRETYTNIVFYARNILEKEINTTFEKEIKILIRVPVYPQLLYGDEVVVTGKIAVPENFAPEDGAKAFDYRAYLAKDNIYYQMYFPKVVFVSHNKGNIVFQKLFSLKAWLMKNISQNIAEPESSLAGGITLGTKQSLGDEWLQKFRETGVAHIVVLSGYNIAVVAGIISRVVVFFPFTFRLLLSGFGIVLFAMMVGGGATVVRATVMALVIIVARMLGREGDGLRALLLAAGFMIFANPMILLSDVSFQLSFTATLALVTLVPVVEKYFVCISSLVFREIIVTTFSTQIFVLPLILYHMGSVSLVGLVANIFILPVVPFAMLVVALISVFAWVPVLNYVLAFFAYTTLAYVFYVVELFAELPFASVENIAFPFWGLVVTYIILFLFIIKKSSKLLPVAAYKKF